MKSSEHVSLEKWHADEEAWWDKCGSYMTYQWRLTPLLNRILRSEVEKDYETYLLAPQKKLLDLGCGSGWLSLHFAQKGMDVLGIDISQEQINAALDFKNEKKLSNLNFECSDFIKWNSQKYTGEFDCIFVNAFLHHLSEVELELFFNKLGEVIRPGGKIYMYEPLSSSTGTRSPFIKIIDRIVHTSIYFLIDLLPKKLGLFNEEHKKQIQHGYQMSSPHERPVDIDLLQKFCKNKFEIVEVKGRHLYSLGFAMQSMGMKKGLRAIYVSVIFLLYKLDKILFRVFSWEKFSQPRRFILCSVKLKGKNS